MSTDSSLIIGLDDELARVRSLLTSPDWSVWVNFLKKDRVEFLQNKINSAVDSGDIVEAKIALALLKDSAKQIKLFKSYISELEKRSKNGGKENGN